MLITREKTNSTSHVKVSEVEGSGSLIAWKSIEDHLTETEMIITEEFRKS